MNTALWIIQGILAAGFLAAGFFKAATPKDKLEEKLAWTKTWPPTNIKLLGIAEILGGIGLVVPWWTGILPVLTPVAAAALAVIMVGAVFTHLKLKESPAPALVLGLLSAFVAFERGLPFISH